MTDSIVNGKWPIGNWKVHVSPVYRIILNAFAFLKRSTNAGIICRSLTKLRN